MLGLKISISPVRDGERVSGTLAIDRRRGDAWVGEKTLTLVSGDPGAERTIMLADDQRITFTGSSSTEIVYDKQQMAAVRVPKAPPAASPVDDDDLSPETPLADIAAQQFEEQKAAEARIAAKSQADRQKALQEEAARQIEKENELKAAQNAQQAGQEGKIVDQTTIEAAKVETTEAGVPGGAKSSNEVKGEGPKEVPQQQPQEAKTPAGWPQPKKNGV